MFQFNYSDDNKNMKQNENHKNMKTKKNSLYLESAMKKSKKIDLRPLDPLRETPSPLST
jgi:hypothetical protein